MVYTKISVAINESLKGPAKSKFSTETGWDKLGTFLSQILIRNFLPKIKKFFERKFPEILTTDSFETLYTLGEDWKGNCFQMLIKFTK